MQTRSLVAIGAVTVVLLAAVSTVLLAVAGGGFDHSRRFLGRNGTARTSCTPPNLSDPVVHVTLVNMGGPMMGGPMMGGGQMHGGMMRLSADQTTVPHGSVSFVAMNIGSINHELLVLPLPDRQIVGSRALSSDGTIDEHDSLGEASNDCSAGSGDGIAPGSSSWVTLSLAPGRYELVCNLPGHYAAGMYTQLTVQ